MIKYKVLPKKITMDLPLDADQNKQLYDLHLVEIEKLHRELLEQMAKPCDAIYTNIMNELRLHKLQAKFHNPNATQEDKMYVRLFFQRFTSGVLKEKNTNLH